MSKKSYWYCPNCKEEIDPRNVTFQELHDTCGHAVEWIEGIDIDRLREICAAERDGTLHIAPDATSIPAWLPCKVGDTVYCISGYDSECDTEIEERTVVSFSITQDGRTLLKYYSWDSAICYADELGKIVGSPFWYGHYLSREAAEAALKGASNAD